MRYIVCYLCVLIFIKTETSATRTCKDCISITECLSPSRFLQLNKPENLKHLRAAYCGTDSSGNKVCCSYFTNNQVDEIENHPNIKLLPDRCGYTNGNRIVGGSLAALYEFPWMALISFKKDLEIAFQCAGSVINERYILTAAHCIKDQNIAGVRIGELDIRYEYDCQKSPSGGAICESHVQDIPVEQVIYHEKYEGYPKYAFDIGLLRLQSPVDFSYKNAAPICLPTTKALRSITLANKQGTVAGWGLTEDQRESSVLLKVKVPIHPQDTCFDLYSRILEPGTSEGESGQFCAGSYHKDSCNGDSGAPLMIEEKHKDVFKIVQYGIVSQGNRICGLEAPAVYTAVIPYVKWILDNMKPWSSL